MGSYIQTDPDVRSPSASNVNISSFPINLESRGWHMHDKDDDLGELVWKHGLPIF